MSDFGQRYLFLKIWKSYRCVCLKNMHNMPNQVSSIWLPLTVYIVARITHNSPYATPYRHRMRRPVYLTASVYLSPNGCDDILCLMTLTFPICLAILLLFPDRIVAKAAWLKPHCPKRNSRAAALWFTICFRVSSRYLANHLEITGIFFAYRKGFLQLHGIFFMIPNLELTPFNC